MDKINIGHIVKKYIKDIVQLPVEIKIITIFFLVWMVFVSLGKPINVPDATSLSFTERHYFRPIILAFIVQLIAGTIGARSRHKKTVPIFAYLGIFIFLTVFLHFNFKAWMPLINERLFDEYYYNIDKNFSWLIEGMYSVRKFIAEISKFNVDFLYHYLFVLMFFVSFTVHSFFDSMLVFRKLVFCTCLILLIGGISYWIAPAEGAYLYRPGLNVKSILSQTRMHLMFQEVKVTGVLPSGYFVASPAAMPSLHIAHAVMFLWFAFRSSFWWMVAFYVPTCLWLVLESICSSWHYLVDIPAGLALCTLCIFMTSKSFERYEINN